MPVASSGFGRCRRRPFDSITAISGGFLAGNEEVRMEGRAPERPRPTVRRGDAHVSPISGLALGADASLSDVISR